MQLYQCNMGEVVITDELEVGHIVGFTYNVSLRLTMNMSNEELLERTIPVVKFPAGEKAIHHNNLQILKRYRPRNRPRNRVRTL